MRQRVHGFSLVEVLIALLVISIGLLGIAKMQALALSNTNGGRLRALAAIEAASLASSMQAERNYWGQLTANPTNITVTGTATATTTSVTVTDATDSTLSGSVTCLPSTATAIGLCTGSVSCISIATPCTAQQMAAYDLQQWAARLQQVMTNVVATITCTPLSGTTPVACRIIVNWAESQVNSTTSETVNLMAGPSFTLFVNP